VSSGSKCADRLMTLRKEVETKMSLYIDAEKQDKLKREAELRAQEAKEKATEDAKDPDQTDDFDRRKMPTKKRIRMAKKNKDEANELFKGKNYVPATKRYIKALRHCEKCFDMNPGEKDEVSKLTLSIRLNLAMSWLKLEKYERAIENATKALELDAKSAKALYRRACCYEKLKKWDEAFRDVKKVLKIKPEDKSSLKLQSRIMKVLAKQKAKAKRMAKKMFG
jgi:heat shock 70kDa protein 4